MKKLLCLALFMLLIPALAAAKPSAEAVQSVLDHYRNGTEIVLVDYKFCSDVAKEGADKFECVDSLDPATLKKDAKVYLWMNFMVPKNASTKALALFNKNQRTMKTFNINLEPSYRYRTWAQIPTDRAGSWDVAIDQDNGADFLSISTLKYTVGE